MHIDLHCHSDRSDGILSPEALVSRAKSRDIEILALTDHDTLSGIPRAQQTAHDLGVTLIHGIEFSSQWAGRSIHIVGLNVDCENAELAQGVEKQTQMREHRAELIAEKLAAQGIENSLEGARRHAGKGLIGRPHFAAHLIDIGAATSINHAFKRYLGAGKPGDVKQVWPDIDVVIEWIVAAGGTAVLAHPAKYAMTRTKLCALLEDFIDAGGRAIEVVSGYQDINVTKSLAQLAEKYKLLASCGSDFHRPNQKWQELGAFTPLPQALTPVWDTW